MSSSEVQEVQSDDLVGMRPARRPGQGIGARRSMVRWASSRGRGGRRPLLVEPLEGAGMSAKVRSDKPDTGGARGLNLDRGVLALAGTMTLASVLLVALVSPWWLLLTGFVGLNLLQSSITGWCPAAIILSRLGVSRGCAFR